MKSRMGTFAWKWARDGLLAFSACVLLFPQLAKAEAVCAVAPIQSPDVPPFFGKPSCPALGSMGETRLAIPQHYLLGPIGYEGRDIWNPRSPETGLSQPDLNKQISSFSIKVRLETFRPIESAKDVEDFGKLGMAGGWDQPKANRWLYVQFKYNKKKIGYSKKEALKSWLNEKPGVVRYSQSDDVAGLQHFASLDQPMTMDAPRRDLYFDSLNNSTLATCETIKIATNPGKTYSSCRIDFSIRQNSVFVTVQNISFLDDIKEWQAIEENARKAFESFVAPVSPQPQAR